MTGAAPPRGSALQEAQQLAAGFAQRAAVYDRDASFPSEDIAALREAGLLGLLVPAQLGGSGAGFVDYVRVATALAAGNGSTALVFNMHASVTGALATVPEELARSLGAPDEFFAERDRLLREAADGALYGVAITEPEAGSRLSAMRTTYERDGNRYRIRGYKSVATGAGHVDRALVAARAADAGPDDDPRVSHFLVPTAPGTPGVTVERTWDPLGMRATASDALRLDVSVDAGALLGGVEGLAVLLAYALPQWLVASYAAVYVGVAQAALDEACSYLTSRVAHATGGSRDAAAGALTRLAAVRARIGRADALVAAARLVLEEAARLVDEAPGASDTNRMIYRAKLLAGDASMDVAATCAEACGLGALRRGGVLERLFRDARCGALMPPASDVCADVLGTAALDLDPTAGDVKPW